MRRFPRLSTLLAAALLSAIALPASAQSFEGMKGRLTDPEGQPLAGYRAVFRPVDGDESFVSGVSDAGGNYVVSLPLGGEFVPVALVTPNGARIELPEGEPPLVVRKGGGRNIQLAPGTEPSDAGNRDVLVVGKIMDPMGTPLSGFRVVFQLDDDIFLSEPSRANGEYRIELRERRLFTPIAAIGPNGLRIPLEGEAPLQPRTNTRRDFSLAVNGMTTYEPAFESSDRLFLSFFEDAAVPAFLHEQSQLEVAQIDSRDVLVSRLIGTIQPPGLPGTEFGLRVGYGSFDRERGGDVSGLTDLELAAKLDLGPAIDGTTYALGFVLTLPTGEEAPGLGHDAWNTKFFAAGRHPLAGGLLTANLGLRISGDGTVLGVSQEGRLSAAVGAGWIKSVHPNGTLIVESDVETKRYDDSETSFRVLAGVNWRVSDLTLRVALAGGLTDSTPDHQLLAGIAFEFD